jgi:predicted nucleic acid-binding protein
MISAIDTNILLDILISGAPQSNESMALLNWAAERGLLIINELIYAELSSQFKLQSELDHFIQETNIKLVSTGREALAYAGSIWKNYARKRDLLCSACGNAATLSCPRCGNPIVSRQHILTDFIIGAFALKQASLLLSRDRGFYRGYFKDLAIKP